MEDIDPVAFYGIGNSHLQMIRSLFPKLRIVARDNVVRVLGDDNDITVFQDKIELMRKHVLKFNSISEEDILDIIKGRQTKGEAIKDVLVYNISGKPIKSRSANQQRLIDEYEKKDMTEPSRCGSRREAGVSSGRHEGENRSIPATFI